MGLFNEEAVKAVSAKRQDWEKHELNDVLERIPERRDNFQTVSGIPIERLYTPEHVKELDYEADLGFPGAYPFTRGVYPTMHRGRLWTRRQIAGFGTAKSTNERYKFLMAHGQSGLSTDFDHPTLTGYDSDHILAEGEVGRLGVAIDTLADMEDLYDGINLDKVSVSLTINHPAIILLGMFLAHAESQGIPWESLRGTVQNDALKEFHGQKTFALPPRPAYRVSMDLVEFCTRHAPGWNTISISGYHTREAGSDAAQEVAFTIAQGMAYAEGGMARGLSIDEFGPRLSFFFGCHNDFFEEAAKFRAARRMWARITKERYGATRPQAMLMRFHTQTLGSTLMRQNPKNNIVRGALQAMAGVLGGTQSLHVSGYDEAYDIPSEDAMRVSLSTQLIVAEESGAANTIDPLAGSFFVEKMTNELEERAWSYLHKLEDMGGGSVLEGMFSAIESGYIENEISRAAYTYQRRIEDKDYTVVGVNDYISEDAQPLDLYEHDEQEESRQLDRLEHVKATRNVDAANRALDELQKAARTDDNMMPSVLAAVRAYASEGEIMGALQEVFGEHRDPAIF